MSAQPSSSRPPQALPPIKAKHLALPRLATTSHQPGQSGTIHRVVGVGVLRESTDTQHGSANPVVIGAQVFSTKESAPVALRPALVSWEEDMRAQCAEPMGPASVARDLGIGTKEAYRVLGDLERTGRIVRQGRAFVWRGGR